MDPVVYFEHNTDSPIWRWKSYVPSGQIEASLAYIMRINQFNCVRHCLQNPPNMILIRYIVMYYRHPSETIVEQLPWNQIEDLSKDPWHLTFGYHLVCYPWIAAFFFQNENIQQKDPLRYDNNTIYFYVVIKIVSVNAISFRILLSWKYVCLSKKKRNVCHIYIVVILFMFYHSLAVSHS